VWVSQVGMYRSAVMLLYILESCPQARPISLRPHVKMSVRTVFSIIQFLDDAPDYDDDDGDDGDDGSGEREV